jgi:acetyl-CoA carboxylase carboxyl transferase subunit alpha
VAVSKNDLKRELMKAPKGKTTIESVLPFEQRLAELEEKLRLSNSEEERRGIERAIESEQTSALSNLSAWERVLLARHNDRPRTLDYTSRIFDDFIELHGDRAVGDDPAMIGGLAQFSGKTVVVFGQQKGVSTDERVERNFGMAHPDGYRKAMRLMDLAERFNYLVISFVDTPAAHPGVDAEQRGQGPAIAQSILKSLSLRTPILSVIIGEGGSGGALAIAVADYVAMFEHAVYVICPPERCAEILWRDVEQKELAASALRLTARELLALGIIDKVLPEPRGGAHRSPEAAAQVLSEEIAAFLDASRAGKWSVKARQRKYRSMGMWLESALDADEPVQALKSSAGI